MMMAALHDSDAPLEDEASAASPTPLFTYIALFALRRFISPGEKPAPAADAEEPKMPLADSGGPATTGAFSRSADKVRHATTHDDSAGLGRTRRVSLGAGRRRRARAYTGTMSRFRPAARLTSRTRCVAGRKPAGRARSQPNDKALLQPDDNMRD